MQQEKFSMERNVNPEPEVISKPLEDDGTFPNNPSHSLVLYKKAIKFSEGKGADIIEEIFHGNKWGGSWRNGIYPFHHYHSTAHEVLGIYKGNARVQFGGEEGPIMVVGAGDVVIIPAGVAHKNINSSHDFRRTITTDPTLIFLHPYIQFPVQSICRICVQAVLLQPLHWELFRLPDRN